MINASNEFVKSMLSTHKELSIKLELFDSDMNYIREVSKQVKSDIGSLTINGDSAIRRSFKMTLDNSLGEFIFGDDRLIWLNLRIKLFVGLKLQSGEFEYVQMGIYVLSEAEDSNTLDGKFTTISAVDKGYFYTDKRGKFINEQIIETGTKITDAIRIIASHVGETMFNFDDVDTTVPYELTYSGTDSRWNAIQELATLAKCTIYFDTFGYLRLRKVDFNEIDSEPITWSYDNESPMEKLYAGNIRKLNDSNLYNDIVVLGGGSETEAVQYRLTVDGTNDLWKNHPYSVQKIGHNTLLWNNGNPDSLLETVDDCKYRAKYMLMQHLGFIEDVQISASPNYLHDVDDVVWISDKANGIEGSKFMVRSLDIPLTPATMSINLSRQNTVIDNWDFI